MAILHNRVSQRELKKKLYQETDSRVTISFYKYFFIEDPKVFRDELYKAFNALKVYGRVYIASEGINAQISVPDQNFKLLKEFLDSIEHFKNIRLNVAVSDGKSFWVLKIKVREKIVADGIVDPDFSMERKGRYVNATEFNTFAESEGTVIIDMRNHYEYEVGHFENAIEIPSDTFREQLPMAVEMMSGNREQNIIMYCTGGIRCEKASSYMLHCGFKNVFHLAGGIINYTNSVKENNLTNKFHGKNFVFDERLGERITEEVIAKCHQCDEPADTHINCANEACHLLFIQCKNCKEKFMGCCCESCKETILLPEEMQKELRKGKKNDSMIFNKSKRRQIASK